jgi:hypothetical protein
MTNGITLPLDRSRAAHGDARKSLTATTVPVSTLSRVTRDAAFALFDAAYEGAERERFQRDLAEKQLVILLHARDGGALKGFSTVLLRDVEVEARPATVLFSGDTVIDREFWGQKQLQSEFARLLLRIKLGNPRRTLYWFLISKGYRTYLLLANAFPRAVPRHDGELGGLRALLHRLAAERFGPQYDAGTGIVHYAREHERVRAGTAAITPAILENPHVRFFVERNPRHADGDELACLAHVRLRDLARNAARIGTARLRRRLTSGAAGR